MAQALRVSALIWDQFDIHGLYMKVWYQPFKGACVDRYIGKFDLSLL